MIWKIWRRLSAIPRTINALTVLRADAEASLRDAAMGAAWQRFLAEPAVAALVPRFSAEWRNLEEAIRQLE